MFNPRVHPAPELSGYHDCACRDCFDIAIGTPSAMCHACEAAGCTAYPGEGRERHGTRYECERSDAYGVDEEGRSNPGCQGEPYRGSDGQWRTVWRTGSADTTPNHSPDRGFDARCGACYLNHAHSAAYHQQEIGRSGHYWDGASGWQPRQASTCWSCRGTRPTVDQHGVPRVCSVCRGTGRAAPPPRGNPLGRAHRECKHDCNCSLERGGFFMPCSHCQKCEWDRLQRKPVKRKPAKRPKKNPKAKKIHALGGMTVSGGVNVPLASCGARDGLVSADGQNVTCVGGRRKGIAKHARKRAVKALNPCHRRKRKR